jgi:hypothetical protein
VPAPFLLEALVALLEHEPERPIHITPQLHVRASAFVPALLDALEIVTSQYAPQSISADALERVRLYTGVSGPAGHDIADGTSAGAA